jgi:multidrug efflux pump
MTSMAFVLGVLPLAIASGAGSASQRSIGTGVMAGMVSAVILSVLFVPVFFVVVRRWFKGSERQRRLYAHQSDTLGVAPAAPESPTATPAAPPPATPPATPSTGGAAVPR